MLPDSPIYSIAETTGDTFQDVAHQARANWFAAQPPKQFKLNRSDSQLRKIYAQIVDFDPHSKVKIEKVKYLRTQIVKYLKKRYTMRHTEIICHYLKIPVKGSFDDFCQAFDSYLRSDV